jgi:hypothetical protein
MSELTEFLYRLLYQERRPRRGCLVRALQMLVTIIIFIAVYIWWVNATYGD